MLLLCVWLYACVCGRACADVVAFRMFRKLVVFMPELPRGPTGKPQRIAFAQRAGLPTLTAATPPSACLFEVHP